MGENRTILGINTFEKSLIIAICTILGAVIGWYLPVIADWVLKLPIIPMEQWVRFISSLDHFWVSVTAAGVGVIAGLNLREELAELGVVIWDKRNGQFARRIHG
ncbi:YqeB family protein [Paenibacillus jiagnxiensis]|uniref:YqeB family protein n=1 Tax=Paenibacillus jiagnxiensis TaxID=3228926 RepID=UPI0033AFF887